MTASSRDAVALCPLGDHLCNVTVTCMHATGPRNKPAYQDIPLEMDDQVREQLLAAGTTSPCSQLLLSSLSHPALVA